MIYTKTEGKYQTNGPDAVRRRNSERMYVNGKYIVQTHPLYKAGKYKNFEDAAFSSLEKYNSSKEGQVYIIVNESFPEWIKVGMAIDAEDRLSNYQTSSPYRDYALYYSWGVSVCFFKQKAAYEILTECSDARKNEWFKCDPAFAKLMIRGTMEVFE